MTIKVAVDVGGTFTDLFFQSNGIPTSWVYKTPSTPSNPAKAILTGIQEGLSKYGFSLADLSEVTHGTTVATNTLLQRSGARVALVTTEGFKDLLEIGRQTRPYNYDMHSDFPPPLVPRHLRFEAHERLSWNGNVATSLTEEEITRIVKSVRAANVNAVAICLLFSFRNPEHERRLAEALVERIPDLCISMSCEVRPEIREYERFSTTILNSYLQPGLSAYLDYLQNCIAAESPDCKILISQSSGGLMPIDTAHRFPVRTALSGPAAGVTGAIETCRVAGHNRLITFDMGGTSADVSLIRDLIPNLSFQGEIGGFPVRLPMVDVSTVGAGGGSIAWFDVDELMKVGPKSAGAEPGPACYGRGGMEPTVTDANAVLGRLSVKLLSGRMSLELGAARNALRPIAERLDVSIETAALGILRIVTANMVRAIRGISVERGVDPREFTLVAFGGAGPLHARDVVIQLGISKIMIPMHPGILCAIGLHTASVKEDFVQTITLPLQAPDAQMRTDETTSALLSSIGTWLKEQEADSSQWDITLTADMRYVGQNFEVPVPLAAISEPAHNINISLETLQANFYQEHERLYGFHTESDPVEIVNIRAIASIERQATTNGETSVVDGLQAIDQTEIWFDEHAPVNAPVYQRENLFPGLSMTGPALIQQLDTTIPLYPNDKLTVDNSGNLIIEVNHG
ncbi:hydantoinase/oxoprolinase family protein [Fodinicurvata sediminis]|uniref:hydantoinase/oxoprolinase family protein n=1 Tax=Fodinicurvata sediminis TaxID=1121832 RepID=UPI0003B61C32|nr:hydantoinase/oxoprolinase family protein [Fodinicurvata sediminis]